MESARLAARWRRRPDASRRTVAGPSLFATGWRWRVIEAGSGLKGRKC